MMVKLRHCLICDRVTWTCERVPLICTREQHPSQERTHHDALEAVASRMLHSIEHREDIDATTLARWIREAVHADRSARRRPASDTLREWVRKAFP